MEVTKDMTIKEILERNKNALKVFMKYGIDACCGSLGTLEAESKKRKVDLDKIIQELQNV